MVKQSLECFMKSDCKRQVKQSLKNKKKKRWSIVSQMVIIIYLIAGLTKNIS